LKNKERVSLANSYIVGYAKDFITDEECNEMIDLALNKISIINGDGIIWQDAYDEEEFHTQFSKSMTEKEDWCHYSGMPSPEAYTNDDVKVECSLELDNEWANESI